MVDPADNQEIDSKIDDSGAESDTESINESIASSSNLYEEILDASTLIGKCLTYEEKKETLQKLPCQPSKQVLSEREKKIGKKDRYWVIVLHVGEQQRKNQGNAFVESGFSNWKKQFESVKKHEESHSHINAKVAHAMFLQNVTLQDILANQDKEQEAARKKNVDSNRKILERIIDTVLLLGKQELAFRAHRESLFNDPSTNVGNFLEILKYLAVYDEIIAAHLEKVEKEHRRLEKKKEGTVKGDKAHKFGRGSKVTFLSNDIQNKLIDIISNEIVKEIVSLVQGSIAWAIIADTTPDVEKHEQLSLCVRIVEKSGNVSEHILFCTRALGTTAKQLLFHITEKLEKLKISYENLVAQTFDGASNMSGKYNGLQAKLKALAGEYVIYVHCYAHSLNLVLGDTAFASIEIAKLFNKLQALYKLVSKSQPIHEIFEQCQAEQKLTIRSLKRIKTVKWSSREFALEVFLDRYDSILLLLNRVKDGTSHPADKRQTANGLLEGFLTKQFVASAILFREIFGITGPLSRTLQSVNINFDTALKHLDTAEAKLKLLRKDPNIILEAVENELPGVEWKEERTRKKRKLTDEESDDTPPPNAKEKWKRDVFGVALDSNRSDTSVRSNNPPGFADSESDTADDLHEIAGEEVDDTRNAKSIADCLSLLTDQRYQLIDAFPTLVRAYAIAMAISITSCSAERSFSTLKRVKTRLRSSMVQDRIEGLMLMSIERSILLKLNRQKLIDLLGKSSSLLGNLLL
ncbi:zinc finger MYM-type protein 1-like [Clytia hemisphaerica]|uniref:zinc finger MYM-type protein 1-like n=1 Tax=Clytia hemisphaerica TaxID=252671 RepID=UPI0034D5B081